MLISVICFRCVPFRMLYWTSESAHIQATTAAANETASKNVPDTAQNHLCTSIVVHHPIRWWYWFDWDIRKYRSNDSLFLDQWLLNLKLVANNTTDREGERKREKSSRKLIVGLKIFISHIARAQINRVGPGHEWKNACFYAVSSFRRT